MDVLAFILALISGKKLPKTTSADAGEVLMVDSDGSLTTAAPTTATITVTNHTLTISGV